MEINDLLNANTEIKEIMDLANSEYDKYTVTDLINIPLIVGPQGPPNVLSIGEVITGEKSGASITGNSPNQKLNLILEKGDKGETGESGVYIGDIEPVDTVIKVWLKPDGEGSNILKVRNGEGKFEEILSIKGEQGIPGQNGKDGKDGSPGPQGPPNVLSIGEVITGEKSGASITGNSPNQKLNLILEKGDTGPQGPPGTPAKNYIIEITNRTIETEITQNTSYEVPTYEVGTNSLSIYFEGSKLIKNVNYIEVDSTHIQFKDWDVPINSNLEIVIRKEEE